MRFVYTKADKQQGIVVISGYFTPDNQSETEWLAEMSKSVKELKLSNEHLGSNGKTIAFEHIQVDLLKMNIVRIKQTLGIKEIKYLFDKNFQGEKELLN